MTYEKLNKIYENKDTTDNIFIIKNIFETIKSSFDEVEEKKMIKDMEKLLKK